MSQAAVRENCDIFLANTKNSLVVHRGDLKDGINCETPHADTKGGVGAAMDRVRAGAAVADDSTDGGSSSSSGELDSLELTGICCEAPLADVHLSHLGCVTEEVSMEDSPTDFLQDVVSLFDWDDTLLPTTAFVKTASPLAPDLYEKLRQHAQEVASTLRAARALGRVAIVTLSTRGWVHSSAAKYLPGLDIQDLFDELDIVVYYAMEHVTGDVAHQLRQRSGFLQTLMEEGADIWEFCKRSAMQKCLRTICNKRRLHLNVVSVGDSNVEKNALKDLLWSPRQARLPEGNHRCKTVKFMEQPTVEQLGEQLAMLRLQLPGIVASRDDLDYDMVEEEDEV